MFNKVTCSSLAGRPRVEMIGTFLSIASIKSIVERSQEGRVSDSSLAATDLVIYPALVGLCGLLVQSKHITLYFFTRDVKMNDEPLRQLSHEEYETLRRNFQKARIGGPNNSQMPMGRLAEKLVDAELAIGEEGMVIGQKAWEMRKEGHTREKISKKLKVPLEVVEVCLSEFERRVGMEAGRMMEHYRLVDNERIEQIMHTWLPVVQNASLTVKRIKAGQAVTETDYDRPMKAAYLVLTAIERRIRMLASVKAEGEQHKENPANVMIWLQQVMPALRREAPPAEKPPSAWDTDHAIPTPAQHVRNRLIYQTEVENNAAE